VQFLTFNEKKSPREIEEYWIRNKVNLNKIHLPLKIPGLKPESKIAKPSLTIPGDDAPLFSSVQSNKFFGGDDTRTPAGGAGEGDGESNSLLGNKLDELNREEVSRYAI
jgi:hypothetical protein